MRIPIDDQIISGGGGYITDGGGCLPDGGCCKEHDGDIIDRPPTIT